MRGDEPSLEEIEDYNGKESKEKRRTVWIVILSGLFIGAIYVIMTANATVSDRVAGQEKTGITKY